jgi:hypothetical protein
MKRDNKPKADAALPARRKKIALIGLGAAVSFILAWLWIAAE